MKIVPGGKNSYYRDNRPRSSHLGQQRERDTSSLLVSHRETGLVPRRVLNCKVLVLQPEQRCPMTSMCSGQHMSVAMIHSDRKLTLVLMLLLDWWRKLMSIALQRMCCYCRGIPPLPNHLAQQPGKPVLRPAHSQTTPLEFQALCCKDPSACRGECQSTAGCSG